jgi:hypothetical protein
MTVPAPAGIQTAAIDAWLLEQSVEPLEEGRE